MTYVLESTHEIVRPEYKSRLIMQNILTGVQEEGIEVTIPEYRTPAGTWTLRTSKRDALDMVASGDWKIVQVYESKREANRAWEDHIKAVKAIKR